MIRIKKMVDSDYGREVHIKDMGDHWLFKYVEVFTNKFMGQRVICAKPVVGVDIVQDCDFEKYIHKSKNFIQSGIKAL